MKNVNVVFVLMSSVVLFLIAIVSFNDAKENLEIKRKEFVEYKNTAIQYKTNHENFSDEVYITEKLETIVKDLGIQNAKIIQKDKTIILSVGGLSSASFQVLFTTILNENFNITKFDVSSNSMLLEIGVL